MALGHYLPGRAGNVSPARSPTRTPRRMPGSYTIIESFEDGISHYGGNTGAASVKTTEDAGFPTDESSYLTMTTGATGGIRRISSTTGLNQYPEPGDTVRFDVATLSDGEIGLFIYTKEEDGSPGGYLFNVDVGDDAIEILEEDTSAAETTHDTAATSEALSASQRYIGEAGLGEAGGLDMTLYDTGLNQLASASASDPTFSSGGIGFRVNTALATDVTAYADAIRVI